jgi:hypothetical protein
MRTLDRRGYELAFQSVSLSGLGIARIFAWWKTAPETLRKAPTVTDEYVRAANT